MKKIILLLFLTATSMAAHAFDYGRWICSDCDIPKSGTVVGASAIPETIAFIKYQNNAIIGSGPTANSTPRWIPNDKITVCDGSVCLVLVYQAAGIWLPLGPVKKDDGKGYQNANVSITNGRPSDIHAIYEMRLYWVDYSNTQPYTRSITVTVGPTVPVSNVGPGYSSNFDFSLGYTWGAATSSDQAGGGGTGRCRTNCNVPILLE